MLLAVFGGHCFTGRASLLLFPAFWGERRFAQLGVAASFQPFWAFADDYITQLTEPSLGPQRSQWLYPIRSVLTSGATMAAGSDWTVSTMDPLLAMQVSLAGTRTRLHFFLWIVRRLRLLAWTPAQTRRRW